MNLMTDKLSIEDASPVPTGTGERDEESSKEMGSCPETKKRPRRIIRRRKRQQQEEAPAVDAVLLNKVLQESSLPDAYSFEIPKTVQRILKEKASHVALQMPEGLLM